MIDEAVGIMCIAVSIILMRCQINIWPNRGIKNPPTMMASINQRPLNPNYTNSVTRVGVRHNLTRQPLRLPAVQPFTITNRCNVFQHRLA